MTEKRIFIAVIIALLGLQNLEAASSRQPLPKSPTKEAVQTRQLFGCSQDEFTCGNNQCIPTSAVCDGLNDCPDAADEDDEYCTVIQTGTCTGRKREKKFCDDLSERPAREEQNNATHQFFCRTDVLLTKEKPLSLNCSNHVWTPTTKLCTRVCQPLTVSTSNVTCFRDNVKVDCSKPLLVGTKIYPQCEFYYQPSVKEVVCQENGEWSDRSIRCDPVCGKQFKDRMRYTREMRTVEYREFPWSIAIYYMKPGTRVPILIPGTIISPYLVVTTAINFHADYQNGLLRTEFLRVVVAKRTSEVSSKDDQFQKSYKVQGIYFTETGFQNSPQSLTSENIAVIELGEKLVYSPSVYPACVNWEKNETLYPQNGEIGQVPHTLTLHEANAQATTQHEILQTIALRFVSRDQCLKTEPMKSIPYAVRTDNFCGEPVSAPAPCDGAFVFLETNTNRFYVSGLVDSITPSVSTPPLFTNTFVDLSAHIDWMNEVRKVKEDRLVKNELRLEAVAADSSRICALNDDVRNNGSPPLDVRFPSGKERRSRTGSIGETNSTGEECFLPKKASLNATNYAISCPVNNENNSCRRIKENSMVPMYTSVGVRCADGFAAGDSDEEAICFKGQWNPILAPCTRYCGKLPKFENGNFTCYDQENQPKECIDRLNVGSKLVPRCNSLYKAERDIESHEFVCRDDGNWVGTVVKCVKKSAQETARPKPNNYPQTRNQNGNNGWQPSARSSAGAFSNSKNSNQTSPSNPRGFAQVNKPSPTRPNTPEKVQPRPQYPSSKSPTRSDPAYSTPRTRRLQTNTQTRNGQELEGDGTSLFQGNDDQNANGNYPDYDDNIFTSEGVKCSENEFSCGDEVCLPYSAVCNGTTECEDGRDENSESCKILSTETCSPKSDRPKYCDIVTPQNKNANKNQPAKEKHAFFCNAKYMEKDNDGIPLNCVNGVSTPSTIPCTRVCKNVTIIASGLNCSRNGVPVDCKKPLLAGTEIEPSCESDYKANFNSTTCNDKGEWDHPIIECIPECGKPTKKEVKMTKTIRPAQFREFPWNVAVYKKTKGTNSSVLFAGIIISPSLVLTNAHCCAAEAINQTNMDMFEVVVGKRSSPSDIEDDDYQKSIKIKAVHLLETKLNTERLAIIELAEKITACPAVQPACVNWFKSETIAAKDGTQGLVPHWRTRDRTNSDTIHEMLLTVAMTLHTRETCQKRLNKEFLKYLNKDAFCVEPIPTVTPAHRGAGFVYGDRVTKLNYVQGVLYFTGTQEGEPTTFTNMFLNLATYMDWINSIRRKTEKRMHWEWTLNTRITESSDVCSSNSQSRTDGNDDNNDNQNGPSSRSAGSSADGKRDDFMDNGCELPDNTWLYLDYNVSCLPSRREKECKKAEAGGVVPEFASLTLSCNEGYVTNGSDEVICFRKNWSPPIEPCKKICDKLELENVTLKCFWEDRRIECDSELKSGTTAIAECAPYHQSEKNLPKLLCDEYGHWKGASEVKCSYFNPWEEKGEYFKYSLQI